MVWKAALAALLIVTPSLPAAAKEALVYGFPGHDSCGNWTENRANRGRQTQALEGWVLGFVGAYNWYVDPRGDVAPGVTATAMFAWLDTRCQSRPLDSVLQATLALIAEMRARK